MVHLVRKTGWGRHRDQKMRSIVLQLLTPSTFAARRCQNSTPRKNRRRRRRLTLSTHAFRSNFFFLSFFFYFLFYFTYLLVSFFFNFSLLRGVVFWKGGGKRVHTYSFAFFLKIYFMNFHVFRYHPPSL